MMMQICFLVLIAIHFVNGQYAPQLVSQISVDKPAFATFIPNNKGNKYHLAISSFNGAPFSADYVYYIGNYSLNETYTIKKLDNQNLVWPNEISFVNFSIIDAKIDPRGGILVPCGFLVPSKTKGSILYYPFTSDDRSNVTGPIDLINTSSESNTWFYHRARLVDMNGDGNLDILTCRSHKPIIGTTLVQLVSFVFDAKSQMFKEILVLKDVCDVFFEVADLDNDGRFEIVAAGFFISSLYIIYSDDPNNSFVTDKIKTVVIDGKGGKFFDVQIDDLDNSGNLELLVTNHQGTKDLVKGSLYYYSLQGSNIRNSTWSRVTVYENFPVIKSGINSAAPGAAKCFSALTSASSRKYILVSGDGSSTAYLFSPSSDEDLTYKLTWTKSYNGYTVGGTSVADLNNDGTNEFIIAIYEANRLDVFTMQKDFLI